MILIPEPIWGRAEIQILLANSKLSYQAIKINITLLARTGLLLPLAFTPSKFS